MIRPLSGLTGRVPVSEVPFAMGSRISIESQLSKRLSAEEALRAAHAVSLAISNGTEQGGAVSSNGLTFARAQTGQPGCAGSSRTEQGGHSQGEAGTAAGQVLPTVLQFHGHSHFPAVS